jgi:hypothetical protein
MEACIKRWPMIGLLVLGATFLGATVFSVPIATAAQSVSATITDPLDGLGNKLSASCNEPKWIE